MTLLAAVANGLVLRALADPAAAVVDRARRRCLLGMAGERPDDGAGLSLEDAVRAITAGRAPGGPDMDILMGLGGLVIGAVPTWQLAHERAALELRRLRARLEERIGYWQGGAGRARSTARRLSGQTAAWTVGCQPGRRKSCRWPVPCQPAS
jgi:hypothetical protein